MPATKVPAPMARARRYATFAEAAEYARTGISTLRRLAARGELTTYAHGKRLVRLDLNEIDAMLEAGGR